MLEILLSKICPQGSGEFFVNHTKGPNDRGNLKKCDTGERWVKIEVDGVSSDNETDTRSVTVSCDGCEHAKAFSKKLKRTIC